MRINSVNIHTNANKVLNNPGALGLKIMPPLDFGTGYDVFFGSKKAAGCRNFANIKEGSNSQESELLETLTESYNKVYDSVFRASLAEFKESTVSKKELLGRVEKLNTLRARHVFESDEPIKVNLGDYLDFVALKAEADATMYCRNAVSILGRSLNGFIKSEPKSAKLRADANKIIEQQKALVNTAAEQEYLSVFSKTYNDLKEYPYGGLKTRYKLRSSVLESNMMNYLQLGAEMPSSLYDCIHTQAEVDAIRKRLRCIKLSLDGAPESHVKHFEESTNIHFKPVLKCPKSWN